MRVRRCNGRDDTSAQFSGVGVLCAENILESRTRLTCTRMTGWAGLGWAEGLLLLRD